MWAYLENSREYVNLNQVTCIHFEKLGAQISLSTGRTLNVHAKDVADLRAIMDAKFKNPFSEYNDPFLPHSKAA